ncbi:alpha/beta hydrolase [Leptospira alstonii]|uniref:Alpha/beta hydrolase domain protein n=2 Tax=Leptospira alstonii TaxID=28452 RepID=M6D2J4_9LEPT|nr:alpha/beta fold hydrolase [Leptospira alstonii]EMJ95403.1 alpha/beta hydrolase domain protein [Leptospira alstonii serovar Sichuan str. 79601]EQA80062.1 alpha/beta hydrolase domain protein [Leptospira alstonii serovar Pingchang str. 80-412]
MRIELNNKFRIGIRIRNFWGIFFVLFALVATQSIFGTSYQRKILTYNVVGQNFSNYTTTNYKLNVVQYRNSDLIQTPGAKNVLCVHGFGDTSSIFEPLAKELILKNKANNVYIVDLPGHGGSTLTKGTAAHPANIGELTVHNYEEATRALLSEMRLNIPWPELPDTIVGHSIGGLVVQLMQDKLKSKGSSLWTRYGIIDTVLIASDIPYPLPWSGSDVTMDDPNYQYSAKALVWNFKVEKILSFFPPVVGLFVESPDDFFINSKYSVNGVPVTGAPTPAQVEVMNVLEPYPAAANIVGLDPTGQTQNAVPRLPVAQNLWSGFNLKVVWLDKDPFFSQVETQNLAHYLKPGGLGVMVTISDPEAVHGTPFSKPSLLIPLF